MKHFPSRPPLALTAARRNGHRMKFGRRICLLAALSAMGLLSGGCASQPLVRVQPWQRATLADYMMNADRDAVGSAQMEHVFSSREQASGGRGVGGSGCGCN